MNAATTPGARRRGWTVLAVAAALAAVLLVVLVARDTTRSRSSPGPVRVAEDNPRADAVAVAEALSSLPEDPQRFVAGAASSSVGGRFDQAVPTGTSITADPASWHPDGFGGGVISLRAEQPGGKTTDYLAVMVQEDESWKVLATFPASESVAEAASGGEQAP